VEWLRLNRPCPVWIPNHYAYLEGKTENGKDNRAPMKKFELGNLSKYDWFLGYLTKLFLFYSILTGFEYDHKYWAYTRNYTDTRRLLLEGNRNGSSNISTAFCIDEELLLLNADHSGRAV
jgi:hypothetical protein